MVAESIPYAFRSFNRKRAVFDSALMLGFWGYLAWNIGWYGSFFTIVIPMLLGNSHDHVLYCY